jgi:phosphate transport system substrate-binding protein
MSTDPVRSAGPARRPILRLLLATFAFHLFALGLNAVSLKVQHPPGTRLLLFVGSNTLGEQAVPELAKAYLEREKKVTDAKIDTHGEIIFVTGKLPDGSQVYVEIHATGSGDCFRSLMGEYAGSSDRCDIGMSSRRVTDGENETMREKLGSNLRARGDQPGAGCEHPVAMDGLAIIVHQSNPLLRISFSEIRAIYSKSVASWKELAEWKAAGGKDEDLAIQPLRRKEPSGTLDFFKERIGPAAPPMKDEKIIPAFTSSRELAAQVAATPGGIGFVGESYADVPGVKRLQVYDDRPPISMKPDEALFPDRSVVRMGIYPLSRFVFLYTPLISINQEVQPFIKYVLSEEGQTVIADKAQLVKIEGTHDHITAKEMAADAEPQKADEASGKSKKRVILRLHGSNTVGAECAVTLAFNYFSVITQDSKTPLPIEDETREVMTPEGEKAMEHDVMCDVDKDGVWETIEIRPTGSSDAFRDLKNGACDVGMSSRTISDAERRDLMPMCGNLGQSRAQFALGLDGLAVIVAPENPIEKLTVEQLRRVFLGEITNWSELGGADRPIQLHARPDRSGTYKHFSDAVLNSRSIPGTAHRHAENSAVADNVAKDPDGIGFVPMTGAAGAKVLKVGYEGSQNFTQPTEETVRTGTYPTVLCRYVYFYVPVEKPDTTLFARRNWEIARDFAEMSQNWRGQTLVASSGFITETTMTDEGGQARRIAGEPIQKYLNRLRDLEKKVKLQEVQITPKLTNDEICPRLLFEFNDGNLTPESRNIVDMKLGPWLKMYPTALKGGLIVEGWADSVGSDEACQKLSLERAQNVAAYITNTLGYPATAVGRGKSFDPPNTNETNKQQNRRVVIKRSPTSASTSAKETESKPVTVKKKSR